MFIMTETLEKQEIGLKENETEYIIYCRKSTDSSSKQQEQSIPDQIKACVEYAENKWLKLADRPTWEGSEVFFKGDLRFDADYKWAYEDHDKKFIIKEQASARTPGKRAKRKALISYIRKNYKEGNKKKLWIISYAPDRQARNMREGGDLISLVDEEKVELHYTSFYFDGSNSGKLLLGILFAIGKWYADNLSALIHRWNEFKRRRVGDLKFKPGYLKDDNGSFYPDPDTFLIIRKAFDLKISGGKSDLYIADMINREGYQRVTKTKKVYKMNKDALRRMRIDPFYCWFVYLDNEDGEQEEVKMSSLNPEHQTMISREEHEILVELYEGKDRKRIVSLGKEEFATLRPIPNHLIEDNQWNPLSFYITKKNQLPKDFNDLSDIDKALKLKNRIRYRSSKSKLDIKYADIELAILSELRKLTFTKADYNEIIEYATNVVNEKNKERDQEIARLDRVNENYERSITQYILRQATLDNTSEEYKTLDKEINLNRDFIKHNEKEIERLKTKDKQEVKEFESLLALSKNAPNIYKMATLEQKSKIIELLFSKVVIHPKVGKEHQVDFHYNPNVEQMFKRKKSSPDKQ